MREAPDLFDAAAGSRLLSVREAARMLGVSEILTRRLIRDGDLPAARIGRRVVIPTTAIDTFARERLAR
jgi:excisionase family DNA binding protein